MLTKNAIGNLINNYKAVLKKCHLLNTFGSLALVGALTMGAVATSALMPKSASALPLSFTSDYYTIEKTENMNNSLFSDTNRSVNLLNVAVEEQSLFGVQSAWNKPNQTLMAGELTYEGETIIAGLTENTYPSHATFDSIVTGQGVNLTLTGLQDVAEGVPPQLSMGDIDVENGAKLTLGLASHSETIEALLEHDITLTGDNSSLHVENIITRIQSIELNENTALSIKNGSILISELNYTEDSTITLSGTSEQNTVLSIENLNTNISLATNVFTSAEQKGMIALGDYAVFYAHNLTLTGGGTLNISEEATLNSQNLTLDSPTTLTSGDILINATLKGDPLTIDNAASTLHIGDATNFAQIDIQQGTLNIVDMLTADNSIAFGAGGKLVVPDNAKFNISGQNLTANMQDFGVVELDSNEYAFVSFDNTNSSVQTVLTADGSTQLILNTNNTGEDILLDNYEVMLGTLAESIFGSGHTFNTANFTINGYGQYQLLSSITADTIKLTEVIVASDYKYNGSSTFTGIVADRQGNADSTISGGGTLFLTGMNSTNTLSAGSITVTNGTLQAGQYISPFSKHSTQGGTIKGDLIIDAAENATAEVISSGAIFKVEGKTIIKNGGNLILDNNTISHSEYEFAGGIILDGSGSKFQVSTTATSSSLEVSNGATLAITANRILNVESAMNLAGGDINFNRDDTFGGTLAAVGFTNNTADLTLTNAILKTTDGMLTDKNLTISTSGGFDLAGGNADFSEIEFTKDYLNVHSSYMPALRTALGTTLTVDIATIGVDANGADSGTAATVVWNQNDSVLGTVAIKGLATDLSFDLADTTSTNYTNYQALSASAKTAYGATVNVDFGDITLVGTENLSITQVARDQLVGLGKVSVLAGDVPSGTAAVVGGIIGDSSSSFENAGNIVITGNTDSETLYAGSISNKAGASLTTGTGTLSFLENEGTFVAYGDTKINTFQQKSSGTTKVKAGSSLEVENFNGTANTFMAIGENTINGKGYFVGTEVALNEMTVTGDPAWTGQGANDIIANASSGVFTKFTNGVDGHLISGQNSYFVLGDVNTAWAQQSFANSGLVWGKSEISAALFIHNTQTLASNGSITVNGIMTADSATNTPLDQNGVRYTATQNTATFAEKSLLVVNASNLGADAALTATNGKLTVDAGANLVISGGAGGQVVTIVDGFDAGASAVAANAWGVGEAYDTADTKYITLMTDSRAVGIQENSAVWDAATGTFTVGLKSLQVSLPGVNDTVNNFLTEASNANLTGRRGQLIDYVNNINTDPQEAGKTAQSMAQPSSVAAVGATGLGVGAVIADASVARNRATGLTSSAQTISAINLDDGEVGLSAGDDMKNGVGVWLMPLYEWKSAQGYESDGFESGYNTGLGGIAVGADYTFNNMFRVGLAFNLGAGYTESNGDLSRSNNDFDFWGLSLYAAYRQNNFGLTADIGYTGIHNQVDQYFATAAGFNSSNADVNSNVWTVGLNAEYTFNTSFMDITPHVGVRYMSVTTGSHDIESGNEVLFNVEQDQQSVWYFPVGVTLSKDIVSESGWTFTPKLDLGFVATAGDFNASTNASMPGVATNIDVEMQNVDGFAFNGGVGFELANDNGVSLGLNYNLQASDHETGHMIFATFRYDF